MLIITRKKHQTINIEGGITITVLETGGGRVKLGIEAPVNLKILRGEVHNKELQEEAKKPQEKA